MIERAARAALHRVLRRVRAGRLELVEAWSGERLGFGPAEAELRAEITIHSPRFYALVARRRSVGLGEAYADGLWDSDDLVSVFRIGALELRLPGGRMCRAGTGDPIVVTVTSNDVFSRLARSPGLGFGESYAAGDWHTDDLPGLIALVVRNLETWRAGSRLARLDRHRPHLSPRQSLRKARANIQYHYDLGNDFYSAWLDPTMTYSSARFGSAEETLEDAQLRKIHALLDRL